METSSKPILIGCDAMLCTDCWYEWYDGDCSTEDGSGRSSEKIKANVLRECGQWGGHGGIGFERAGKYGLLNGMEQFIYEQQYGERHEDMGIHEQGRDSGGIDTGHRSIADGDGKREASG